MQKHVSKLVHLYVSFVCLLTLKAQTVELILTKFDMEGAYTLDLHIRYFIRLSKQDNVFPAVTDARSCEQRLQQFN